MSESTNTYNVIIVGGGLAGLSAAIHLAQAKVSVLVLEKKKYGTHKVCGEYISNEVLPYLEYLGVDMFDLGATKIDKFELSTVSNRYLKSKLPLGGFGISRFTLDKAMAERAKNLGVKIVGDTAVDISYQSDCFQVTTLNNTIFHSRLVIGAYGKRNAIDKKLKRPFIQNKSPYLGVKIHVKGTFPNDVIALHNFEGGYCGVSKVENDVLNLCYITDYEAFKPYKNIADFQEKVVFQNTYLRDLFQNSEPLFDAPLSISQISFSSKSPVENHILMCGDTAGMIHPLCGNGMSMAIRAAQIASVLIIDFLDGKIDRVQLEKQYAQQWNKNFALRLKAGHSVAKIFDKERLTDFFIRILNVFPSAIPKIIQLTHGKPMSIK